jgi:imidazolonepropionase-like amidohydrolase
MSAYIFENCRLFDGVSRNLRDGTHVLVVDGRIEEVSDSPIKAGSAERIDVAGRTLMPGLIDAHVHAVAATPNLGLLDAMPQSLIAQYSRRFLEAALNRGFTSLRDAGGADYGLAAAIERGLIKGPRLFYSGKVLSQTGGHGDLRGTDERLDICPCCKGSSIFSHIVDGVDAVRAAAREELRKGASQIKIMASGGVSSPSDPIWVLQYSKGEIKAAVEEATAWRTYVMAHAYTAEAIDRCLAEGVRSIEHANLIDAKVAEQVKARDAFVVPTLVTYAALEEYGEAEGFPAVSLAKLADVRSAGVEAVGLLRERGVRLGFGTDLLGEMHVHQGREFLIRREVESPVDTMISATSVNAALLQKEGALGCIAPGAEADLLVVDGDPTVDVELLAGQGEAMSVIMTGGQFHKRTIP